MLVVAAARVPVTVPRDPGWRQRRGTIFGGRVWFRNRCDHPITRN
jgi:hypothetical protein